MSKSNKFWNEYKGKAIRSYLWFFGGLLISLPFGFFLGNAVGGIVVLGGFIVSMYYGLSYRNTACPHCKQYPQNFKNIFFPIDPICKKCGKRMDEDFDTN